MVASPLATAARKRAATDVGSASFGGCAAAGAVVVVVAIVPCVTGTSGWVTGAAVGPGMVSGGNVCGLAPCVSEHADTTRASTPAVATANAAAPTRRACRRGWPDRTRASDGAGVNAAVPQ